MSVEFKSRKTSKVGVCGPLLRHTVQDAEAKRQVPSLFLVHSPANCLSNSGLIVKFFSSSLDFIFPAPPETLEMRIPVAEEEFKGFSYLRVFNDADQVDITRSGLLFCRQL